MIIFRPDRNSQIDGNNDLDWSLSAFVRSKERIVSVIG